MSTEVIFDNKINKFCIEYLYCEGSYCTMTFKIKSSKFTGESNFCISKQELLKIIEGLNAMNKELSGNIRIKDSDSDSYININVSNKTTGHLSINGQIGGSFEDNFMKFKYKSDQTIILNLINFLKSQINI